MERKPAETVGLIYEDENRNKECKIQQREI